jgi:ubiquinone/menaquinone biosynthesis C-methylase UbiE
MPPRDPDSTSASMRDFWDQKARENAMYYISSYRAYDQQDPAEFWKWGGILAEKFLTESGLQFTGQESMLEIGCGVGRMTKYFAGRFRHVTGLDVSEEMIRQGRDNLATCSNVRLDVGNGIDLSAYPDASFDFVFSYIVFQHIPDVNVTLTYVRDAGRVLRPGGNFYFQVNTLPRIGVVRATLGRLKRALLGSTRSQPSETVTNGPRGLDHPAWQGSRVTLPQVAAAASAAGMGIERTAGEGTQYTWVLARRNPANPR